MSKNLVIVESPAKCKTIKKYLGKDYEVLATYGHMVDLLPKKGSVDPDNDFAMKYEIIERNARHVDIIAKKMKQSDNLFLATDPDREGEAISWHVFELMKKKNLLNEKSVHRVVFHEITKSAIVDAIANPRQISMDLVNAQQARRALDYLVGFNLSPLLWKKIRRGLSAGRVQSPALRLIVEREIEIEKFEEQEYWTIESDNKIEDQPFKAKLTVFAGEKLKQFSINNTETAQQTKTELLKLANDQLTVIKVDKKQRKRNPSPPFITSTLQQEAARKLGFSARKTMMVAQQLYEGVDIGTGTVGLITYMRTDSVILANDALDEIRSYIEKKYGKDQLPKQARTFKTKSKNAQEAHEAIRPTASKRTPAMVKDYLSNEQFKLYDLIHKRTIASQMLHATVNTVAIDLSCGNTDNIFRANGSTIADPGFLAVYQESYDDKKQDDDDGNLLPPMQEGDVVKLCEIHTNQHFTEPPPRYSEASLVKALEEHGIGRPSTYASIIYTLQQREYVTLDKKRFYPSDVGRIVNKFLTEHFNRYVDYGFTASLEDELDAISRGEKEWIPVLEHFWQPFNDRILKIDETVQRKDVTTEALDEKCPECGQQLSIRLGRRGRFIGCNGYPDCSYTRSMEGEESTGPEVIPDRKCPDCESELIIRSGRYGKFIGCSGYPNCKFMEPLVKPADTGVLCPVCQQGSILERKSRRGKIFYSCARYPDCEYALWNAPIEESCPKCKWPILTLKVTKKSGTKKLCPQKECGHSQTVENEDE